MKYLLSFLLITSLSCFAYDASLKGFIALDALDVTKQMGHRAPKEASIDTGIGVLHLNVYSRHQNFSSKIKLDVDGNLSNKYQLFEEVTVRYYFNDLFNLTAGKGLVPFHRKHWGVMKHCYIDGGTILQTENSWRDQDRKMLLTLRYGNWYEGFFNYFSLYGKDRYLSVPDLYKDPANNRSKSSTISELESKTYNLQDGFGLADKFELIMGDLRLSVAGNYYKHDLAPKASWAVDAGGQYKNTDYEIWWEMLYGETGNHYKESWSVKSRYEHNYQLGGEYNYSDLLSFVVNFEAAFSNTLHYYYYNNTKSETDGPRMNSKNYKGEWGVKVKFGRTAYWTFGLVYERKYIELNDPLLQYIYYDDLPAGKYHLSAWSLKNGLAYWF